MNSFMKYLYLLLIVPFSALAQPRSDSARLDSSWASSPHLPYLNQVLAAGVLEGRSTPVEISPTGQKLCFDKKIKVKSVIARGPSEVCLFINTETGLIAYTPVKPGSAGICDIKPDHPEFSLTVIGLKGNTYSYKNVKKKNTIEHWVQTSNSDAYRYQFAAAAPTAELKRKAERRSYCSDKIKARLYKVDGRPEEWFLFGKNYPDAVVMADKKYLGNFAVGYQYSDKGLFIIMQMVSSVIDSKILDIEDVDICFDPAPFKIFEDEQQTKGMQSIRKQRERLDRDRAKPEKYEACESKKQELISFRQEALNRQEQNLQQAAIGNMQQNTQTQLAQAELMNYDDMAQQLIYEAELNKCRAQQGLAASSSQSSREMYQKKIECCGRQIAAAKNLQTKFAAINSRYRNTQPGLMQAEKAKEFLKGMVMCD